ncbi:hypothetical protein HUN01_10895 [Nostoc edaphicum CCNP1411]|uniref:Uncharacterized protein n=1 Tax=Nostoc edaphicum CCNP1411 TaxID=1472755 RepID=A0A7D7L9W1_9NOSO|nr:hypothetical protein [Nostoc edaphicum]QMS88073.1 hypothetical protein HUN01_10895 [Nostoc edaphicum CCNP1411]
MKRVSKALDERGIGDWYFYSALAQRPAIHVQHFQARRQEERIMIEEEFRNSEFTKGL